MTAVALSHEHLQSRKPTRVVVLGAGGFIAGAIRRRLEVDGISTLSLGRPVLDLLEPGAAGQLAGFLKPDDVLVVASAKAPCKDVAMLGDNIRMIEAVCLALQRRPVAHVVYLSSDAVYRDSTQPLTENSCAEPGSLHGVMHLSREIALRNAHPGPLALIRPTLVYGYDDPHNGYGPNRFGRLAAAGEDILLFGEGEELRDHVDVEDVAGLVRLVIVHRSSGIANAVSGSVVSFRDLADFASAYFPRKVSVRGSERSGPMPHNGYRAFNNLAVLQAFQGFSFKGWREGLGQIYAVRMKESVS